MVSNKLDEAPLVEPLPVPPQPPAREPVQVEVTLLHATDIVLPPTTPQSLSKSSSPSSRRGFRDRTCHVRLSLGSDDDASDSDAAGSDAGSGYVTCEPAVVSSEGVACWNLPHGPMGVVVLRHRPHSVDPRAVFLRVELCMSASTVLGSMCVTVDASVPVGFQRRVVAEARSDDGDVVGTVAFLIKLVTPTSTVKQPARSLLYHRTVKSVRLVCTAALLRQWSSDGSVYVKAVVVDTALRQLCGGRCGAVGLSAGKAAWAEEDGSSIPLTFSAEVRDIHTLQLEVVDEVTGVTVGRCAVPFSEITAIAKSLKLPLQIIAAGSPAGSDASKVCLRHSNPEVV